jgi:transposase
MGRKQTRVTTLHNNSLETLIEIEEQSTSKFTRRVLRTVIMSYQGIHIEDIVKSIGVAKSAILRYIHDWNEAGLESIEDARGGSVSSVTDEMLKDITMILTTKDPREFGFVSSCWSIKRIAEYIDDKYSRLYSYERMRQIIQSLNFSYKRGQYHPTLANPKAQEAFKKNDQDTQYCRKIFD